MHLSVPDIVENRSVCVYRLWQPVLISGNPWAVFPAHKSEVLLLFQSTTLSLLLPFSCEDSSVTLDLFYVHEILRQSMVRPHNKNNI